MKRNHLFLILIAILLLLVFTACRNNNEEGQPAQEQTTEVVVAVTVPASFVESPPTVETLPDQPQPEQVQPEPTPIEQISQPEPQPEPFSPAGGVTTQHTVQEREWLAQIARCYGASPQDIVAANAMSHPGWIMSDELLTIPNVGSVSTPVGPPCLIFYRVIQGDTLFSIARTYSIPLDMLVFANYGCYGYNAHNDWVSRLPHSYAANETNCAYTNYPLIYPGDLLVIPATLQNASLRP